MPQRRQRNRRAADNDLPVIDVDGEPQNADWLRTRWPETWPPYKSPDFLQMLRSWGTSLEQFRTWPLYQEMVRQGRIRDDEWVD